MYGNAAFLISLLSTESCYSSFLKKVFVFQKIYFKVKDPLEAFDELKTRKKSVGSNIFGYIKVCIF